LQNSETNARQAVIKWILASDLFDTMVIGMNNYDKVAEYLAVSGTTSLTSEDNQILDTVAAHVGKIYCRPGCGDCYGKCPNDVPVSDILRYKMYFENYGNEKHAMAEYRAIPEKNSAVQCAECSGPCETSCPYNVKVRSRLIEAHEQLTLA
ncbi:4Fe-4S dicluster domain-containing protein, partial [candidate division KSB1 bacterium]